MSALQTSFETVTLQQYENFPEDVHAEVFDGQIFFMSAPSSEHQLISTELTTIINTYIKNKHGTCRVFHAPYDVLLNENPLTIVQPDLMIICDKDKVNTNRCIGAPDFIIEIVSPSNASDDYIKKLYYYKNYGVREYWIVDPKRRIVTVYYFEGDLIAITYSFNSTIKVNIYDDFYINFEEITNNLDF